MFVSAIIVAAGKGLRFKSRVSKPLVKLGSKPVIMHSLEALNSHRAIKEIIVVANSRNKKAIDKQIKRYNITKAKATVLGGLRRQDSVMNGLKAVDTRAELVLIHDAARPFIDKTIISRVILEAANAGAAIAGVPVKATIKAADNCQQSVVRVKETLDRNKLWEIQTPQVFKKDLILKAYKRFGGLDVTDEAMLVEKLKENVSITMGSYRNIKITTPEDLVIAEAICRKE